MYKLEPVTDRVQRMRDRYRNSMPTLDADRTRIITEYYKESRYEIPIIRRATALYKILTEMVIRVEPDELIVGNCGKYFRGCCLWAEYSGLEWMPQEFDNGVFDSRDMAAAGFTMPEEDRDYIRSVVDFWRENGNAAQISRILPEEVDTLANASVLPYFNTRGKRINGGGAGPHGHFNANYRKAVEKGFGAIKREAEEKLNALRGHITGNDAEKWYFYQAIVICCNAVIEYSKRFSAECLRQANEPGIDDKRKKELLSMADSLNWIMENSARTYWEACQVVYFYHLILNIEGSYLGITIGRFDQHCGDYLERDLAEGRITMEFAQEITDCFCLKVGDLFISGSEQMLRMFGAYTNNMRLTLAGRKKDGTDATNTCTYLTLYSIARLKLHDPTLSLCLHKDSPAELWEAGIETAKICGGIPTLDNCDLVIDILHKRGLSIEDARNFCVIGCVELSGSGCEFSNVSGPFSRTHLSIANVVLQAINDGQNPANGKQGGLHTGYLSDMKSFDEVKDAFTKQLNYFMDWFLSLNCLMEYAGNPLVPVPIASATMDGCMESGKDMLVGGAKYNSTGGASIGIGTAIDSLVAIKYLVYDNKICTGEELLNALKANWEGYEALRARAKAEIPFWGNGDPYSDEIASFVSDSYANKINSFVGPRGGYRAGLYSAGANVMHGYMTYATPNGRKAGEPVSDGASPSQAADKNGPTCVACSEIALHPYNYGNGLQFTMKFHPNSVKGAEGTEKLTEFVQSFFEDGGMQIQYNVVSSDILREAQKKPEEYKDLVVRVAGFSAYFVELYKDLQNDLISRTDNTF